MRFTAVAFAALCGLAVARETSLKQRQIALLQGIISEVAADVKALDQAITSFTSDPKPVVAASEALIKATHDGAAKAKDAATISDNESLTLQKEVTNLMNDVEKTVNDLIAKKSQAAAAGAGGQAYGQLVAQLEGATALSEALISKVPAKLQPVGKNLSDRIIAAVNKGVTAYSEFKDQAVPAAGAAAAGGAAAGAGAAAAGTTGQARVSNAAAAAPTGAATNSTAAAPKGGAGALRPAGAFAAVALGAAVLAL